MLLKRWLTPTCWYRRRSYNPLISIQNAQKQTGWLEKKLTNPKFRKAFREEYEKLSIEEQLLKLRLQADMTQAEVAKKVGTTASAISRYENAEYDRYEVSYNSSPRNNLNGGIDFIRLNPRI